MVQENAEKLLRAIEADDITYFDARYGTFRLGRFPVLSLMYLYNAKKLLAAYEAEFIKISRWEELTEPFGIVARFSQKAGKCLRLYYDTVVSPLEMLLILDKARRLKKLYPKAAPTEEIKSRLQAVYYVKYALGIKFEGDKIIIDRRPLRYSEKRKIIIGAVGGTLAAAALIATPVSVVSYVIKHAGDVTSLGEIDFAAKKTYTLLNDITIPTNYSVGKVNCTINGGGHTVTVEEGVSLGEFNGGLKNVTLNTDGAPIINVCTDNAVITNVTVNVNADIELTKNSAFIAVTSYGTFDGVTVNVTGSVKAAEKNSDGTDEIIFGAIVSTNAYTYNTFTSSAAIGTVKNCTVNYTDFYLYGETDANASFGGVVGVNNGYVQNCTVTGKITADTFDLGGVCYKNNSAISRSVNDAELNQTSGDEQWTPIVGGIVVDNTSLVEYCQSSGKISVKGQELAICAGIAARTYGQTYYCLSSGDITVNTENGYVGGIFGMQYVATDGRYIYIGLAQYCLSRGSIYATLGGGESCVGGVGGRVQEAEWADAFYGGRVLNCIFIGGMNSVSYSGSIVGASGADIYEANVYFSGGMPYPYFDGNYYLSSGPSSFGAVITLREEFLQVSGKGASAMTEDEIKNTELYHEILSSLGM